MSATRQTRLVVASLPIIALAGVFAWIEMPRQEDPDFPARYGAIDVFFPGADAETMERLVVGPLEDELAQVDEIRFVDTTVRTGVAAFFIELRDSIYDTDRAWGEVREAIDRAKDELPAGASEPNLNDSSVEQESIVLAVSGSSDPLELREAARRIRQTLLRVDGVIKVSMLGDPGEQITIEFDESSARRLGLNQHLLTAQLAGRNRAIPGGTIRLGDSVANLRPGSDFGTFEELERTPIVLPSGAAVELRQVARVRRGIEEPVLTRMRHDGRPAVGLGVTLRNSSHLVDVGRRVRQVVARLQSKFEPLRIEEVSFQPDYVDNRLRELGMALLQSILIVAVVLFLTMGRRSAMVVASMVPLVALGTLAIFWVGGGVLHQMSIAAFVIALGMLVDNAIVVVEHIQANVDEGIAREEAAKIAVRDLWVPLAVSTATTIAAFLPMLLASGTTADFTRALPVVIMLALTISLFGALFVTPILCGWLLRPARHSRGPLAILADHVSTVGVGHAKTSLLGAGLLLVGAAAGALLLEQRFFPAADRNQVVIELRLQEGAHLEAVNIVAKRVEALLDKRGDVVHHATFVGRAVPRFYYNLGGDLHAPFLAQLLVTTRHFQDNAAVASSLRSFLRESFPEVQTRVIALQQGPHVRAPIEVRLIGDALIDHARATDIVQNTLKTIDGTVDVDSDLDLGSPSLGVHVVDAAAGRSGVSRSDVAMALLAQSRGLPIGEYRGGKETIPIVLGSSAGESTPIGLIPTLGVASRTGGIVPLGQVATTDVEWTRASVRHRNGRRITRVLSSLAPGVEYSAVLSELTRRLAQKSAEFPKGIEMEFGGAAEGSGAANASVMRIAPFGALVILLCLLWEFRSFRRVAIVMATIPLCAIGIVPGLLVAGEPFGFMSLLGVIALAGIVVNNAIVLLDLVEQERAKGTSVADALKEAVRLRTRPILLTTATTVAGLVPLAFSSSTLWPPLAWSMISGLTASTFLTLFVVPALYWVMFQREPLAISGTTRQWSEGAPEHSGTSEPYEIGPALSPELAARLAALGPRVGSIPPAPYGSQPSQGFEAVARAAGPVKATVAPAGLWSRGADEGEEPTWIGAAPTRRAFEGKKS